MFEKRKQGELYDQYEKAGFAGSLVCPDFEDAQLLNHKTMAKRKDVSIVLTACDENIANVTCDNSEVGFLTFTPGVNLHMSYIYAQMNFEEYE